jgi:hypothetical protein
LKMEAVGSSEMSITIYRTYPTRQQSSEPMTREFLTSHSQFLYNAVIWGFCWMEINWLTSWSWAPLERPPVVRPLDSIPAFYGTRRFNTEFTRAFHLSLSWARPIQPTSPHPTSPGSILILSIHLCLGLPTELFPSSLNGHYAKLYEGTNPLHIRLIGYNKNKIISSYM